MGEGRVPGRAVLGAVVLKADGPTKVKGISCPVFTGTEVASGKVLYTLDAGTLPDKTDCGRTIRLEQWMTGPTGATESSTKHSDLQGPVLAIIREYAHTVWSWPPYGKALN